MNVGLRTQTMRTMPSSRPQRLRSCRTFGPEDCESFICARSKHDAVCITRRNGCRYSKGTGRGHGHGLGRWAVRAAREMREAAAASREAAACALQAHPPSSVKMKRDDDEKNPKGHATAGSHAREGTARGERPRFRGREPKHLLSSASNPSRRNEPCHDEPRDDEGRSGHDGQDESGRYAKK